MSIKLREVTENDQAKLREFYEEYLNSDKIPEMDTFEGIRDFECFDEMSFKEWIKKLELEKDKSNLPKEYSSHTLYLAINEYEKIVGAIGLRWEAVPILMAHGGFIGYSVRPTERGKGYATQMLKLGLKKFKEANINKILITCKDFNIASKKVIEKNGGILENIYYNEEDKYAYLRYWIEL